MADPHPLMQIEAGRTRAMNDDTAPKPDGGPAFPNPAIGWGGMTLRDWFAGQALAGMTAGLTKFLDDIPNIIVNRPQDLSEIAFTYADAMIAHRNATREG